MNPNLPAFLETIAWSEGTSTIVGSDAGYNVLVTGDVPPHADVVTLPGNRHLFKSYEDHPRILVHLTASLESTAAGRYQLLARYYDAYKRLLALPDFSPSSQDAIALQQIRERHALSDLEAGDALTAIDKCSNIWASLPGHLNTYGQPVRQVAMLLAKFTAAGGTLR